MTLRRRTVLAHPNDPLCAGRIGVADGTRVEELHWARSSRRRQGYDRQLAVPIGTAMRNGRAAQLLVLASLFAACGRTDVSDGSNARAHPTPIGASTDAKGELPGAESDARARFARELELDTRREVSVAGRPEGLCAFDVDGDGREDLLLTTRAPGTLTLWRASRGGIGAEPEIIVMGDWPLAPVGVCWGSGGKRCVAVASRSSKELTILDLAQPSQPVVKLSMTLPAPPRAMAAGDLDGDGEDEIVVATDGASLRVLHAGGRVLERALRGKLPRCLAVLGRNSIAVGFQDVEELHVYADVARDLEPSVVLRLDGFPRAMILADLDGDGDRELVVVSGDRSLRIWGLGTQDDSRAWLDPASKPLSLETAPIPTAVCARDLDGDGASELIVACYYGVSFEVWSGFRSGRAERVQSAYVGQTPVDVQVLDLDGDGKLDLAAAARDAHALSWLRGDGHVRFRTPLRIGTGRFPRTLTSGNLDTVRGEELAVIDAKENAISILAFDGARGTERQRLSFSGDPRALCCTDCDGDGVDELLTAVQEADGSHLRAFSPRQGRLVQCTQGNGERLGAETSALLAGTWDPKRGRTLLATDAQSGTLACFALRNGADTQFSAQETAHIPMLHGPCALAWYEEHPNALAAVVLGGPGQRRGISFVRCDEGRLSEVEFLPSDESPRAIACEDLDGDGRRDLAVLELSLADPVRGNMRVWLRQPGEELRFVSGGTFSCGMSPRSIAVTRAFSPSGAQIFVASQDGHDVDAWRVDVLSADREPELDAQLRVQGLPVPGLRVQRLWGVGAGVGCIGVRVVDVHGDGRRELAVVNAASDEISVIWPQVP